MIVTCKMTMAKKCTDSLFIIIKNHNARTQHIYCCPRKGFQIVRKQTLGAVATWMVIWRQDTTRIFVAKITKIWGSFLNTSNVRDLFLRTLCVNVHNDMNLSYLNVALLITDYRFISLINHTSDTELLMQKLHW